MTELVSHFPSCRWQTGGLTGNRSTMQFFVSFEIGDRPPWWLKGNIQHRTVYSFNISLGDLDFPRLVSYFCREYFIISYSSLRVYRHSEIILKILLYLLSDPQSSLRYPCLCVQKCSVCIGDIVPPPFTNALVVCCKGKFSFYFLLQMN